MLYSSPSLSLSLCARSSRASSSVFRSALFTFTDIRSELSGDFCPAFPAERFMERENPQTSLLLCRPGLTTHGFT